MAGVNSRRESQRFVQEPPTRSAESMMRKGLPLLVRWYPAARPAWPAPITMVS